MVQNKAFIYKAIPDGWPESGKDLAIESSEFDLDAAAPKNGIVTKNLYVAFDPSQRGRMRDPSVSSYSPAMQIGKPVEAVSAIAKVLKSDNSELQQDDLVLITPYVPTETYSSWDNEGMRRVKKIDPRPGVPPTAYLGALGMTGMTAYGSLHHIGKPKKGESIWVSGAAGAVGQVVGQIAAREGLNVIGSAGDDKKVEFLTKELGFTSAFNYKKEKPEDALKRLAPDGIDIFFDNVGGEQLEAAIDHLNLYGRIIACGGISQYNNKTGEAYGIKNTTKVIRNQLLWQGFIVFNPEIMKFEKDRDEKISKWIAEGSFKSVDYITYGMDNAINGFLGMLKGENLGKSILQISEE